MSSFGPQAFLGLPAQIGFLPTRIYSVIGTYPPRWGEASALSLILVALTVICLVVQRAYLDRRSYVTVTGRSGGGQRMSLGPWRWAVFVFCLAVVTVAAIAPVAVLTLTAFSVSWIEPLNAANLTLDHFRTALIDDPLAVRGITNSFRLAGVAAVAATLIGLFIAYVDVRTRMRGRALLDYLAILPLGLPGTVMAVGVLLAFIRPPLILYGTVWILLAAYTARLLPLSVRIANGTLRQLDPSLEEAARISGATWLGSIRHILLPLAWPGIVVAFLLAFIPALSELSSTILLYTSNTETIAIAMFTINEQGRLEVVAALAVFTIAIILAFSLLLNRLGGERASLSAA
jgi:iron(III) transport system permease protein